MSKKSFSLRPLRPITITHVITAAPVPPKGMVSAAEYIRRKLREDDILNRAFRFDTTRGTQLYDLVLVGHSLGAGTAAILAILLKQEHPNLSCFAYSPPGGLLRYYGTAALPCRLSEVSTFSFLPHCFSSLFIIYLHSHSMSLSFISSDYA